MKRSAVFLDKDGTIIDDVPYNANPALINPAAGAFEALRVLQRCGYMLFVVSNQEGLALGRFQQADLQRSWRYVETIFARQAVCFSGFYYCPHLRGSNCSCRKPQPGLLFAAAAEHGVDLSSSWMIGDILHDVEAGNRAGCRTVLIDNGNETEWDTAAGVRRPDSVCRGLWEASCLILAAGALRPEWGAVGQSTR